MDSAYVRSSIFKAPFTFIRNVGVWGIVYTVLLVGIGALLLAYAQQILSAHFLEFAVESDFEEELVATMERVVAVTCYILLVPLSLVAILLPLRHVWIKGRASFRDLTRETFLAIRVCGVSLGVIIRPIFYYFAPAILLICLIPYAKENALAQQLTRPFLYLSLLLLIVGFWRSTEKVATIPLAILSGMSPAASLAFAPVIISGKRISAFFFVASILCLPATYLYFLPTLLKEGWFITIGAGLAASLIEYYLIIAFGLLCVSSAVKFFEKHPQPVHAEVWS